MKPKGNHNGTRMNAHNLNQSGKKIPDKPYDRGEKVYFYQPPSQNEVIQRGRKAKHLMHYRDPATITQPIPGRRRQYEIEFEDKLFKRDIYRNVDTTTHYARNRSINTGRH